MRKSFLIAVAAGAFALGGVAYAGGAKTPVQPTVQAPVPMTNVQMQKVTAGSAGTNLLINYGLNVILGNENGLCVLPDATNGQPSFNGNAGAGNVGPCGEGP